MSSLTIGEMGLLSIVRNWVLDKYPQVSDEDMVVYFEIGNNELKVHVTWEDNILRDEITYPFGC